MECVTVMVVVRDHHTEVDMMVTDHDHHTSYHRYKPPFSNRVGLCLSCVMSMNNAISSYSYLFTLNYEYSFKLIIYSSNS